MSFYTDLCPEKHPAEAVVSSESHWMGTHTPQAVVFIGTTHTSRVVKFVSRPAKSPIILWTETNCIQKPWRNRKQRVPRSTQIANISHQNSSTSPTTTTRTVSAQCLEVIIRRAFTDSDTCKRGQAAPSNVEKVPTSMRSILLRKGVGYIDSSKTSLGEH